MFCCWPCPLQQQLCFASQVLLLPLQIGDMTTAIYWRQLWIKTLYNSQKIWIIPVNFIKALKMPFRPTRLLHKKPSAALWPRDPDNLFRLLHGGLSETLNICLVNRCLFGENVLIICCFCFLHHESHFELRANLKAQTYSMFWSLPLQSLMWRC